MGEAAEAEAGGVGVGVAAAAGALVAAGATTRALLSMLRVRVLARWACGAGERRWAAAAARVEFPHPAEVGEYQHEAEGEMVCNSTHEKVPYFNAYIFLENKTQIGKVEEVFGPTTQVVRVPACWCACIRTSPHPAPTPCRRCSPSSAPTASSRPPSRRVTRCTLPPTSSCPCLASCPSPRAVVAPRAAVVVAVVAEVVAVEVAAVVVAVAALVAVVAVASAVVVVVAADGVVASAAVAVVEAAIKPPPSTPQAQCAADPPVRVVEHPKPLARHTGTTATQAAVTSHPPCGKATGALCLPS